MSFVRTDTITHAIGARGRFALGLVDGEVRVRAVDGDDARVTVRYEIDARSDDEADRIHDAIRLGERRAAGQLELNETRRDGSWPEALARLVAGGWRHGRSGVTIEAEVPRGASVRIRGVTAEIRVEGTGGELELKSVSGGVTVEAAGGSVTLETVSGHGRVAAAGSLVLRSRTVSGDVAVSAGRIEASRLTTVSGNVEIEGAFGDAEHRVESASGGLRVAAGGPVTIDVTGIAADVRSEVEHRLEGSIGHRRVIVGTGGPVVRFRTMSGSLLVAEQRRPAPIPAPRPAPDPAVTPPAPMTPAGPMPPPPAASPPDPAAPPRAGPPTGDAPGATDAARLAVLRAVERGEIDVDEALRKLGEASRA